MIWRALVPPRPEAFEDGGRVIRPDVRDHILAVGPDPVPQEIRRLVRVRKIALRIFSGRAERPNLVTLHHREVADRLCIIVGHPAVRVRCGVVEIPPLRLTELDSIEKANDDLNACCLKPARS